MRQGRVGALRRLAYKPPEQSSPTTVEVPGGTTVFSHTFSAGEDGLVALPGTARKRGITVEGGRHIRIIGGEIDLTEGNATQTAIRAGEVEGSITIEGVRINGAGASIDLMDLGGNASGTVAPDVYLLNLRCNNITGTSGTNHSDLYQPQRAIRNLYVDKVTGLELQYQGFFLRPQYAIAAIHMNRVNLGYQPNEANPQTYLLWFAAGSEAPVTTTLSDVYIAMRPGQALARAGGGVWPKEGEVNGSGEAIGFVSSDGGLTASAPARTLITGYVTAGTPGGGDFVKTTDCGLGYISPGYLY